MSENSIIKPAAISEATGISLRAIRQLLPRYPGAVRISPPGVCNPRLGLRQNGIERFLDWLESQPKEKVTARPAPVRRGKPKLVQRGDPIPYR